MKKETKKAIKTKNRIFKAMNLMDLEGNIICKNIKNMEAYYKNRIKYLEKENNRLKSDKKYKELEEEVKRLNKNSVYIMSDKEKEEVNKFIDKHYKEHNPKLSCESMVSYVFCGDGIGTWIKLKCNVCGETTDIMDDSKW